MGKINVWLNGNFKTVDDNILNIVVGFDNQKYLLYEHNGCLRIECLSDGAMHIYPDARRVILIKSGYYVKEGELTNAASTLCEESA